MKKSAKNALRAIVTDIEGTTSSISFVHDVLFPYARRALPAFVAEHRDDPDVRHWLEQVAAEIGEPADSPKITETLIAWIDADRKHTALKALQGMIWEAGYGNGEFRAHVYADVPAKLREWKDAGLKLYVYSSGSVPAQKLLFAHTDAGDLTPLFDGYFDTQVGGKRESASYERIVAKIGVDARQVLFLSDVVEELDAARKAGLHTVLVERGAAGANRNGHVHVADFAAIRLPS